MAKRPSAPRVTPLAADALDDRQRELLGGVAVAGAKQIDAANIFATLVRHPGLFRHWLPFGGKLLSGKLPARDRELMILRTGWLCQADYEWGQHVIIGRAVGITDDEIPRIIEGPDAAGWAPHEAMLLRATDELHHDSCIADATWAALAEHYGHDAAMLIEIPMVVGHYHLVSFTLNSLGIQREPGVEGFPA